MTEITDGPGRDPMRPERSSRVDPQPVIDLLCEHFANDALDVEEFERRVGRAHRAGSEEELQALVSDLPELGSELPARADAEERGAGHTASGRALVEQVPLARPDQVRERDYLFGCMGGVERKGRWVPARSSFAGALMGAVEIDLREAIFPPGTLEIRAGAVWGAVEIVLPPGVEVDCSGLAIMGGFGYEGHSHPDPAPPGAPKVRVTGFALMGGVEVSFRHPGETAREARRRRRRERKALRRAERERRRLGRGDE